MMRWNDKPVYICCGATDMRKSINGLMTLVKESFSLDPFAETLYVFCNRKRDRLKILEWDLSKISDKSHYLSSFVIRVNLSVPVRIDVSIKTTRITDSF